ncbi:MAG: aminotransferase class I/II-fold pyridoxal phosphate-dependent enzyme [Kiritimatiellaeota bacterium]|nr:aminotransferase class I/II-fold pyridoxal phosphate-dependent enzyme [Kiritimatiellota bacterium]
MPKPLDPLAVSLNEELASGGSPLLSMLSGRGRRIYFPSAGILGQSAEAKGCAINATIGMAFEEDGSPLCLECVEDMTRLDAAAFLYAPSFGLPDLRAVWADMLLAKNPSLAGKAFSLPVVTSALTHGLTVAGYLFLDAGDEVVVPDLYWDNYELVFENAYDAALRTFPMFTPGGAFNADGMERLLMGEGGKKVVLLNFPNNPTGYTATHADEEAICAALARAAGAGKRIVALLDDAYFGLVYEPGVGTESMFGRLMGLHPNILAVKLDGPTKEDYVWGARVGFITFGAEGATAAQYKALEAKAGGIVRGTISNVSSVGQHILLQAYRAEGYARQKQEKCGILKKRYDRIRAIFREHPEYARSFAPMPFNSGYFMCVKPVGADPEALRRRLLRDEHRVGVVVLSGLIRIAFATVALDKLDALFAHIHAAVQELGGKEHTEVISDK